MKDKAANFATVGVLFCTLILTAVVLRREFMPVSRPLSQERSVASRKEVSLVGRAIGPDTAPVVIVVFSDFQCPYCAKGQPTMDSLRRKYPTQVKFLYRHLPLETLHPLAWPAAQASECAADQGEFPAYHDLLFRLQDSLGRVTWPALAERVGIRDLKKFERCITEERHSLEIKRDILLARELNLRGTPTFIIDTDLFEGNPPFAWFDRHVSEVIRRRKVE